MTTIVVNTELRDRLKIESAKHKVKQQDLVAKILEKVLNNTELKLEIINEIKIGLGQNQNGKSGSV